MRLPSFTKSIYVFTLLGAVTLLTASTSFSTSILRTWAEQQIQPFINLYKAHRANDDEATQQLSVMAANQQSLHWQTLLAEEGVPEAQYALAMVKESMSEKRKWLRAAAAKSHSKALYQLAMLEESGQQKQHYFELSAQLDYMPAVRALYQWLWMQGDYHGAVPWMLKIVQSDAEAALRLGQYYWHESDYENAKQYLELAKQLENVKAIEYLNLIERFWLQRPKPAQLVAGEACNMRLQFVATGLDSAVQAQSFKAQFENDPQMNTLPICINDMFWAEEKSLACDSQAVNNYRISCHLERLDGELRPEDFTHLVVFHSRGKANVINGVMHLDLADKYSVFIHELAHFVGFIDEYPLGDELADFYCQPDRQFPNILVVEPETDLQEISLERWQTYGEPVAMSRARTCNNHENLAYKLSSKMTFMEFHDSNYIPPLYLAIWAERLQDPVYMKPAALNIAQALEEVGNSPAAQAWWMRFHEWRSQSF